MADPLAAHSGRKLAHNALLNLVGQTLPLAVAIVALPLIIRGLGHETFGAFQLAWVILGYFAVFDLGLGRATTKFVAEYVGRGATIPVPGIVATAVTFQGVLGVAGGIVLALLVPTLVNRVFDVPPALAAQVARAFYVLAAAVPVVLLSTSFSGVLQAVQRFGLVNIVQSSSSVATYALPLLVLALGGGLVGVVAVVVVARVLALAAYIALVYAAVPAVRGPLRIDRHFVRPLLAFGSWVTVTNVVNPLLVYLDRALIAAILGLAAVTYYTAPYDVVLRLSVIPASLVPPVFAAVSAIDGVGDTARLARLFLRSAKLLALAVSPIALTVVLLARPTLALWLGADFAVHSTLPAQLFAVAVLVNAMAQLPYATLQGVGRADLPAKFHLLEFPLYAAVLWALVTRFGIAGAAGAWLARVALDSVLLYGAAVRAHHLRLRALLRQVLAPLLLPLAVFGGIVTATGLLFDGLAARAAGTLLAAAAFAAVAWRHALDETDREPLLTLLRPLARAKGI